MKRSKTQAVYRFLPEMWVSEKDDSERAVSAKIKNWNYIRMTGIYENFIEGEIKRQIKLFGDRGGDISAFDIEPGSHSFTIVETACNEGIPDIIGEMSPLVFYSTLPGLLAGLIRQYYTTKTNSDSLHNAIKVAVFPHLRKIAVCR